MIRTGRVLAWLSLGLLLAGCKPPDQPALKAIVGAILIDGTGGPPISDCVVTIEGSRIRAVGSRASLPVPAAAEKIDGSGKFLIPGLIDLQARLDAPAGGQPEQALRRYLARGVTSVRSGTATDGAFALRLAERQGGLLNARLFLAGHARTRGDVAALAARKVDAIEIGAGDSGTAEGILEEARKFQLPVTAEISSLADVRFLADSGAAAFSHMIQDTEAIDPAWIARWRDLQIVFIPTLSQLGASTGAFALARRNTKKLAEVGVALAIGGDDPQREMELLVEAGLSAPEVLVAATRQGALALRQLDQLGTIEPGKRADLLLVSGNPVEDIRNLRKIDRVMLDGQWIDRF